MEVAALARKTLSVIVVEPSTLDLLSGNLLSPLQLWRTPDRFVLYDFFTMHANPVSRQPADS